MHYLNSACNLITKCRRPQHFDIWPMPQHIQDWFAAYKGAQTEMPDPSRISRRIGLKRR